MTTLAESIEQKKERLRVQISHDAAAMFADLDSVFRMLRDTPNDALGMAHTAAYIFDRAASLRTRTARFEVLHDIVYTIEGHRVENPP